VVKKVKADNKQRALDYMKNKIIVCEYQPGEAINIDEVAAELEISKTPVREALLELQYENYVQVIPRKSTIVSKISPKEIEQIYGARLILETAIYNNLQKEDLEKHKDELIRLKEYWTMLDISSKAKDGYIEALNEDLLFHKTLVGVSNNTYLVYYAQELLLKSQRYWHIGFYNNRFQIVKEEHLQILDAMLSGDINKVVKLIQKHITASVAIFDFLSE